jgi:hypothetical protein
LHTLPRNYDQGVVWLAKVVAGASTITTLEQYAPALPLTRIPKALTKTQASETLNYSEMGSSLLEGGFWYNTGWGRLIFYADRAVSTYATPSDANTRVTMADSGAPAETLIARLGQAVAVASSQYSDTAVARAADSDVSSLNTLANNVPIGKVLGRSVALGRDLLICGCIANGLTDNLAVAEGIMRILAANGQEAIITTDNAFAHPGDPAAQDADAYWIAGEAIAKLAARYNRQLADTAAYMREKEWRGINPYADSIHQNTTYGMPAWAECIAGSVAHTVKLDSAVAQFDPLIVPLSTTSTIPGGVDVEVGLTIGQSAGTLVTGLAAGTNRIAAAMGMTDTTCYDYTTGGYFLVAHSMMLACGIAVSANTTFGADVYINGAYSFAISQTANGNALAYHSLRTATQLAGVWGNYSLKVVVTSGTLRLYGNIYQTPAYTALLDKLVFRGTWAMTGQLAVAGSGNQTYTDTLNDFCEVKADAASFAIIYAQTQSAGQIAEAIDGDSSTRELYISWAGSYTKTFKRTLTATRRAQRCLRLTYAGQNGAAAAASGNSRRLGLYGIYAILDR